MSFNNVVDSKKVECFDPLLESWLNPARKLAERKSDFVVLEILTKNGLGGLLNDQKWFGRFLNGQKWLGGS